jgi:preprotein translocase subunit SecG
MNLVRRDTTQGEQMAAASCRKSLYARSGKYKIMIYGLIVTVHILVCFFIIIVVLLQSGKSGDISAAFGGQGSQTAFGPRGAASALSKATTWSAVAFMITSITLSVYSSRRGGPTSVLQGLKSQPVKTQPAPAQKPATPPAQQK